MGNIEDIRRRVAEGYSDDGIQAQHDVSVLLYMLDGDGWACWVIDNRYPNVSRILVDLPARRAVGEVTAEDRGWSWSIFDREDATCSAAMRVESEHNARHIVEHIWRNRCRHDDDHDEPEMSPEHRAALAALSAAESEAAAARDEASRLQAWMYAIEGGDNPILDEAELRLMANYAIRGDDAP